MSLTDHGPCWPDPEPSPECCPLWATATAAQRERAGQSAAFILWALTGRRIGVCEVTVRPCSEDCTGGSTYYGDRGTRYPGLIQPVYLGGGVWRNCMSGCACEGPCSCCHVCGITLTGVVQEIVEVRVDGAIVPAADYRVDDHRELVRVSGDCWPRCADLEAPCDQVGSGGFCVTYRRGIPLDAAALNAYETYACNLLAACLGDRCCKLPDRITSIVREGVRYEALDPMTFVDQGLTGLRDVDMWIRAVNPYGHRQQPRVYSPDLRPPRMTTWP